MIIPGMPKVAGKPPETRRRQRRIAMQASGKSGPCKLLDFRLLGSGPKTK
jgi:hypothetical protein